jgi:hypothetical protein
MAAEQGIFVYQESATGFDLVSPTPLTGSLTGKLTVGPDGHIYLINSAAGAIQRYSTDGSFIDSFIVSTMGLKPSPSGESFRFYNLLELEGCQTTVQVRTVGSILSTTLSG